MIAILKTLITLTGKSKATMLKLSKLLNVPQAQLAKIASTGNITKALGKQSRALMKQIRSGQVKIAQELAKLDADGRKALAEIFESGAKETQGANVNVFVNLSSAALAMGMFTPTSADGSVGNLELTFRSSSKVYLYPGVPKFVWEQMTSARGRNGGGAYSVFLALYLRSAQKTKGYQRIKETFSIAGINEG